MVIVTFYTSQRKHFTTFWSQSCKWEIMGSIILLNHGEIKHKAISKSRNVPNSSTTVGACVTQNIRSTTAPWWVCSGFNGVQISITPMTTNPGTDGWRTTQIDMVIQKHIKQNSIQHVITKHIKHDIPTVSNSEFLIVKRPPISDSYCLC